MGEQKATGSNPDGGSGRGVNGGSTLRETAELLALLLKEIQQRDGPVENPKQKDIDYVNVILRQIDVGLRPAPPSPYIERDGRSALAAESAPAAAEARAAEIELSAT